MDHKLERDINLLAQRFILNPETFSLYRGENETNQGGLHFTTNRDWAKKFGATILLGRLPARCKCKLLSEEDFDFAANTGIFSEGKLWDRFFSEGYDAIVGYDAMNPRALDVIVNPVYLDRFKHLRD